MDEDTLRALNYANELLHQQEQEMLAADPGYREFLTKVENDSAESERHDSEQVPAQGGLR